MCAQNADVLSLYRVFDTPAEGFEVRTADDRQLLVNGLPRRPDPVTEPHLDRLWRRMLARNPQFVKAELSVTESVRPHWPKGVDDFGTSGWAGVYVETASLGLPAAETANVVYAEWLVPEVLPSTAELNEADWPRVAFWVGLDGATNSDVLQAGTVAAIVDGHVSYWAWTEWYTDQYKDPPVKVGNFPISPGNHVGFLVCAPQSDHGFVHMVNYSTNLAMSVGVQARPGVTLAGSSAEWVVEGNFETLPDFNWVTFTNITAGTPDDGFNLSPKGVLTEIKGSSGLTLTETFIVAPTTMVVLWGGAE